MGRSDFMKDFHNAGRGKMMIYIAGPFFNEKEIAILTQVEKILSERGLDYFSPRQHAAPDCQPETPEWSRATFLLDRDAIDRCALVLMVYHGNYSDSGTAWESGYAYATGKPVVAVHTGDSSNLMVHESAIANIRLEDLPVYDFQKLTEVRYTGKMY